MEKIELDTEQKMIKELVDTLKSFKENNFKTQAGLILEARKQTKLYEQILHQLSRQNSILDDRKIVTVKNVH